MKRLNYIIAFLLSFPFLLNFASAQRSSVGERVSFSDTTWYDRGFDVYIGGGMFWGSPKTALYYNGSRLNECNLDYLFNNQYWREEINKKVAELYPNVSISGDIYYNEEDLNWNPRYNTSVFVGLGLRYKIGNNWGVSLSYSFSRLSIINRLLLTTNSVSGNTSLSPELTLSGKEDRSMIDLSFSYLFSRMHRVVKPFVEVGAQFNYIKVKKFDAILLDKNNKEALKLTLLDPYGGENYVPGVQMSTYDVIYGGPGYGVSFAAGLKFVVGKYVSIDPTFYGCLGKYSLKPMGNKQLTFNYGAMVRIVMNDFFFQNR